MSKLGPDAPDDYPTPTEQENLEQALGLIRRSEAFQRLRGDYDVTIVQAEFALDAWLDGREWV